MSGRLRRAKIAASAVAITGVVTGCASSRSVGGGGAASCVSPTLTASKTSVHGGDSLKVSGHWFVSECHDVVVNGRSPAANAPIQAVPLVLSTRRGQVFDVGTAHPDGTGSFTITVTVPDGAAAGPASVASRDALGIPLKITISP